MEIKDYLEMMEEISPGDDLNDLKAEAAWALGLDEFSEDWDELMEI